jgi:hypothetical protein
LRAAGGRLEPIDDIGPLEFSDRTTAQPATPGAELVVALRTSAAEDGAADVRLVVGAHGVREEAVGPALRGLPTIEHLTLDRWGRAIVVTADAALHAFSTGYRGGAIGAPIPSVAPWRDPPVVTADGVVLVASGRHSAAQLGRMEAFALTKRGLVPLGARRLERPVGAHNNLGSTRTEPWSCIHAAPFGAGLAYLNDRSDLTIFEPAKDRYASGDGWTQP